MPSGMERWLFVIRSRKLFLFGCDFLFDQRLGMVLELLFKLAQFGSLRSSAAVAAAASAEKNTERGAGQQASKGDSKRLHGWGSISVG